MFYPSSHCLQSYGRSIVPVYLTARTIVNAVRSNVTRLPNQLTICIRRIEPMITFKKTLKIRFDSRSIRPVLFDWTIVDLLPHQIFLRSKEKFIKWILKLKILLATNHQLPLRFDFRLFIIHHSLPAHRGSTSGPPMFHIRTSFNWLLIHEHLSYHIFYLFIYRIFIL